MVRPLLCLLWVRKATWTSQWVSPHAGWKVANQRLFSSLQITVGTAGGVSFPNQHPNETHSPAALFRPTRAHWYWNHVPVVDFLRRQPFPYQGQPIHSRQHIKLTKYSSLPLLLTLPLSCALPNTALLSLLPSPLSSLPKVLLLILNWLKRSPKLPSSSVPC